MLIEYTHHDKHSASEIHMLRQHVTADVRSEWSSRWTEEMVLHPTGTQGKDVITCTARALRIEA